METTVEGSPVFARLIGGAELRSLAGTDEAEQALAECVARLCEVARRSGRVVKALREKVLVLADSPEAAAEIASALHACTAAMPSVHGVRFAVAVGFHHGQVIRLVDDVFGGSVNLAARLAEQAVARSILTTEATARRLGAQYRCAMRRLGNVRLRGFSDALDLCELDLGGDGEATVAPASRPAARRVQRLRLVQGDHQQYVLGEESEIVIGRDVACDLVVHNDLASRRHCTIERRADRYVLTDHSANGTWVTAGSSETRLHRDELALGPRGLIVLGEQGAVRSAIAYASEDA